MTNLLLKYYISQIIFWPYLIILHSEKDKFHSNKWTTLFLLLEHTKWEMKQKPPIDNLQLWSEISNIFYLSRVLVLTGTVLAFKISKKWICTLGINTIYGIRIYGIFMGLGLEEIRWKTIGRCLVWSKEQIDFYL